MIVGPDEVTSRLHMIRQPDSPVEITSVDFTGMQLLILEDGPGRNYTVRRNAVFEVKNRSDQVIDGIEVSTVVAMCQNLAARPGGSWKGRLMPGER